MIGQTITAKVLLQYKLVIYGQDRYSEYCEKDSEIVVYGATMEQLIDSAQRQMIHQLIEVHDWELYSCECILYKGKLYEAKSSCKNIKQFHQTFMDDITSTQQYKLMYEKRQNIKKIRLQETCNNCAKIVEFCTPFPIEESIDGPETKSNKNKK